MSDDETVEVTLQLDPDMVSALRRVRRNQRKGRKTRTAESSTESPARVVSKLLTRAYSDDLRKAKVRDEDNQPGSQWM